MRRTQLNIPNEEEDAMTRLCIATLYHNVRKSASEYIYIVLRYL